MNTVTTIVLSCLVFTTVVLAAYDLEQEKEQSFWKNRALKEISRKLRLKENYNVAKNVILFLGDGLSVTTLTGGRILKGQLQGNPGEETELEIDKFPRTCLSKTYCFDRQTTDSAASATAYLAGVKARYGTIGYDASIDRYKCSTQTKEREVTTILDWAKEAGKSVGIVTTARLTHASPAGSYAHAADRGWEDDSKRKDKCIDGEDCTKCKDIARQLIEDNSKINVAFGGGRKHFLPKLEGGNRLDNRSLVQEWKDKMEGKSFKYVTNTKEMNDLSDNTDYVLGLFSSSHMSYELERDKTQTGQPHIKDMTKKAIKLLSKNEKGFFLFVEAARIDHGHHDGVGKHALYETIAFDEAIAEARKLTKLDDTITVVTSDHSFTMSLAGYSQRGNGILDTAFPVSEMDTPVDGYPYTTILYSTGNTTRKNMTNAMTNADGYKQDVTIVMEEGAHDASDVTVHADGPMSHLFTGVQEQTYIAYVMAYAACIGPFADDCDHYEDAVCSASSLSLYTMTFTIVFLAIQKCLL